LKDRGLEVISKCQKVVGRKNS